MSYHLQKISNVINHQTINLNKNLKLWNAYKTVYESGNFHHTGLYNNTNKYFEKFGTEYKFKYIKYDDEFDMLYAFF